MYVCMTLNFGDWVWVLCPYSKLKSTHICVCAFLCSIIKVAPVAQRYHVTSDTLGREFDPGKRDFSH